jgi:hypothetical protein
VGGIGFRSEPLSWSLLTLRHEISTMAVLNEPDNTPLPGTVFTPRQVRALKIAVIVMGILLVGGFAFVLAAIVYQASKGGQENRALAAVLGGAEAELVIPEDAAISSMSLDGGWLALHLRSAAGSEIVVVDLASGKVITRIRLKPQ